MTTEPPVQTPLPASQSSSNEPPLVTLLEALLFVASGPVSTTQLAAALERPVAEVEAGMLELETALSAASEGRGLRLQRYRGRFQLITAPQAASAVERFLGLDSGGHLSRAALEALAIILYRQPVTRPQIDAVRGVNSEGVLKGLVQKGLVQEIGRAEMPGRPILFSATPECLQYFGLASLSELPPLGLDDDTAQAGVTPA